MPWRTRLVALLFALVVPYVVAPPGRVAAEEAPSDTEPTLSVRVPSADFTAQQETHWCWAASVANAFRAAGHEVAQARVVREVYGEPINMRSGPNTNVSRLLDRPWIDDAGRSFRARLAGVFDAASSHYALDGRELVGSLRAGRPLILGTTSHAMLLIGARYQVAGSTVRVVEATVFDPWPGVGVRTLRPEEMVPVAHHGSLAFIADVVITH